MIRATGLTDVVISPLAAADTVTLDYDNRQRRRIVMTSNGGTEFLLDLPNPLALKDGHVLALDNGGFIVVRAADERLLKVQSSNPRETARIAWHLGNRHLPAQIEADCIFIRYDHVIAEMLMKLGAEATEIQAPFEPESGAYSAGHHNG